MNAPAELVILGIERAADTTTMDNLMEMVGMVDCLPLEFGVLYTRRLLQRPEFANPPMWVLNRLTDPAGHGLPDSLLPFRHLSPATQAVIDAARRMGVDVTNLRLDDVGVSSLGLPTTEEK